MFKKFFATSLLFISLPLQASELTTYKSIEETLTQGNLITIVAKADACTINNPDSFPIKVGTAVFKPHAVLISNEGYLASTGSWFVSTLPTTTGNGVDQRYKVVLNNLNQGVIIWEFFDADTGQKSSIKTIVATCELGKGIKVYNS